MLWTAANVPLTRDVVMGIVVHKGFNICTENEGGDLEQFL